MTTCRSFGCSFCHWWITANSSFSTSGGSVERATARMSSSECIEGRFDVAGSIGLLRSLSSRKPWRLPGNHTSDHVEQIEHGGIRRVLMSSAAERYASWSVMACNRTSGGPRE